MNGYVVSADSDKGKEIMKAKKSAEMQNIDLVLQNLEQLTAALKDPKGPLLGSMQNVNLISESIADNRENLEETIDSLAKIAKNLESVSKSLKENPLLGGGKKKQVKGASSTSIDINERYGQYK